MSWYKVDVSEDQMMQGQVSQMQEQFGRFLLVPGLWRQAALYGQTHKDDYGETVYLYCTSPVHAPVIVRLLSMVPCDPPSAPPKIALHARRHLSLLVGDGGLDAEIKANLAEDEGLI